MSEPNLTLIGRIARVDKGIAYLSLWDIKDERRQQEYTADVPLDELNRRGVRKGDSFKVMAYQNGLVRFEVMPLREISQEEADNMKKRVREAFSWLNR